MEDIGQLIFVVLFILFGLISSSKKKKVPPKPRARGAFPPPSATPSRPEAREVLLTDSKSPAPAAADGDAETVERPKRALAEELLVFLQGQVEPVPEPPVVPPQIEDEAMSVETLEAAGVESHERFREKYVDALPQQHPYEVEAKPTPRPYAVADAPAERPYLVEEATIPEPYAILGLSKRKRKLTRSELRHAFVMKEVLGPPKALEQ